MIIRPFTERDYPTISWWWDVRDFTAIPLSLLPPAGVIVEEDGKPIAACFLYLAPVREGQAAWAEWAVTCPGLSPRKAKAALELVLEGIISCAKAVNAKFVFTSLRNRGLQKLYSKAGFIKSDEGMTNYIYRVGG